MALAPGLTSLLFFGVRLSGRNSPKQESTGYDEMSYCAGIITDMNDLFMAAFVLARALVIYNY